MDNEEKLSLTYVMHVNWFWIKQRPQFIAEELNDNFDLKVFSPSNYIRRNQIIIEKKPRYVNLFFKLPFQRFNKYKLYQWLDSYFVSIQLKKSIKNSKYIWVTSPIYYHAIKKLITHDQVLIYDCMDDFIEFPLIKSNIVLLNAYKSKELALINRANYVIFSSFYLKTIISNRYKMSQQSYVVNNAVSEKILTSKKTSKQCSDYPSKFGWIDLLYVGTISHWFNFDLIIESLNVSEKIRYVLIGPMEIDIPIHNRIIYLGTKKHDELNYYMSCCDALIMPFIVNDLIKSVNPVKLYEYIYSGKPIITCSYPEMKQFKEFVHQYKSNKDFIDLIQSLVTKGLSQKEIEICETFAWDNTWSNRGKTILQIITH